jgi:hypothetical protein
MEQKMKVTHGVWIEFSCEKDPSQYAEAANKALKDAVKGFDDIGDVSEYGVVYSKQYGISFEYEEDHWPAVYCAVGDSWGWVTDAED